MKLQDILSPEEIARYNEGWESFKGRYKLNSPYNTHSGMPVISEVYQFPGKPLFRAHVFGRRLMRFDPYFVASKHPMPFWNAQHYFMVGEQMYSASLYQAIGKAYNRRVAKEVPIEFNWKKPIFFKDNISVELIRIEEGKVHGSDKETGYFTIYSDKSAKLLSRMSASSYWQDRTYFQLINKLKNGENSVLERLVRVIDAQDINQKRRIPMRQNLPDKNLLIEQLKHGKIPEAELHDFFSFWGV